MMNNKPKTSEYTTYQSAYVNQVADGNFIEILEISLHDFIRFVQNVPMDKYDYRYADGKWLLKDIMQHIIDTERIFAYRALRISRNDATVLPGFEENDYAKNTNATTRSVQELLSELAAVRQSTILLFKSFSQEQLLRIGKVANYDISVRAIGYIIIGHAIHHQKVFQERYLV